MSIPLCAKFQRLHADARQAHRTEQQQGKKLTQRSQMAYLEAMMATPGLPHAHIRQRGGAHCLPLAPACIEQDQTCGHSISARKHTDLLHPEDTSSNAKLLLWTILFAVEDCSSRQVVLRQEPVGNANSCARSRSLAAAPKSCRGYETKQANVSPGEQDQLPAS